MQGYDTLVGAWNETGRDWSATPWQSETRSAYGMVKQVLNRELVQYTRVVSISTATGAIQQMGTKFQCSLPKVLYGNNVQQLPSCDVPAALDCLHELIKQDFPDAPHPSEATPRRIDVTDNRLLPSEKEVKVALAACAGFNLGRTKPYIGDSGSVNWPQNSSGHSSKVYSKFADIARPGRRRRADLTDDLLKQAAGVLRVEAGVSGLKGIRSDMAKALALAEYAGDLTVGAVLGCPGLSTAILGPLNGVVDTVLGSEVLNMKIDEFMQRFIDAGFSYPNAISKIGYAAAVKESGWDSLMLTRQGIGKLKKEFERAGVDPLELEMGPILVRLTKPYTSSGRQMTALERRQAVEDGAGDVAPAATSS